MESLKRQVGGSHYKNFKIQPVEFIQKNELSFLQGCIIKRICRFNIPGGKGKEDLRKIQHESDLLIDLECKKTNSLTKRTNIRLELMRKIAEENDIRNEQTNSLKKRIMIWEATARRNEQINREKKTYNEIFNEMYFPKQS